MNERVTGTVKNWKEANGYGFLSRPGEPDVFVHFRQIDTPGRRELLEGETVEFEIVPGNVEGKVQAAHVIVI